MARLFPALALAMLVPAGSGSAQEAVVDPAIVAACFDGAPRNSVAPGCIGLAARLCENADRPTTIGSMSCAMAETAEWDAILNREYSATREHFQGIAGVGDTLLAAQRAWIALRDADCKIAYDRYDGGSMRVIASSYCRLEHTARRALELKNMRGY